MTRVCSILATVLLFGCGDKEGGGEDSGTDETIDVSEMCVPPDASGRLQATLSGAIEASLDWGDADMSCGGGVTGPTSAAFSFESDLGDERLIVLITVEGYDGESAITDAVGRVDLTGSAAGDSAAYTGSECLVSLTAPTEVGEYNGVFMFALDGTVECSTPADAMVGEGSVTITDLSFRGVLVKAGS